MSFIDCWTPGAILDALKAGHVVPSDWAHRLMRAGFRTHPETEAAVVALEGAELDRCWKEVAGGAPCRVLFTCNGPCYQPPATPIPSRAPAGAAEPDQDPAGWTQLSLLGG